MLGCLFQLEDVDVDVDRRRYGGLLYTLKRTVDSRISLIVPTWRSMSMRLNHQQLPNRSLVSIVRSSAIVACPGKPRGGTQIESVS